MVTGNDGQTQQSNSNSSGKSSRRKWLKMAGTGSIALLAGCSSGGNGNGGGDKKNSKGETVIEYWRWPHSTQASNDGENAIVKAFNKLDNGVQVKQVKTPYLDYPTKLKSAIGSKSAPAVGWNLSPSNLYETAGKSQDEIAENAPYTYLGDHFDASFMDEFWSKVWDRQRSQYKGIISIPFVGGVDPGLFYINVDAWKAAGMGDLPKDGWSIQEWHDAMKKISGTKVNGTNIKGYIVGLKDINSRDRWTEVMYKGRTMGKIIEEGYQNKNDEYVFTFADDAMSAAWDAWYGTPIEKGWVTDPSAYTKHQTVQQFYEGQAATAQLFTWARAGIADNANFEWAIVPFPTRNGKDHWLRDTSAPGMSAFKDEIGGNVEAAVKFIQYRTSAKQAFKFFNVSGQAVPNEKAYQMIKDKPNELSNFVKKSKAVSVMDGMDAAFKALEDLTNKRQKRYPDIKSSKVKGVTSLEIQIPRGAGGGQLQQQTGNNLQRLVAGQVETKEALVEIEKQWQQTLKTDSYSVDAESVGFNKPKPGYNW